jgi:hypothetical protein
MLPNGTFKTTERHRLDDLNEFSLPFIRAFGRPVKIMDVAVSSGSTTIEWRRQLEESGVSCEITATDKTPCAYELTMLPGITAFVDENRVPLHFSVFGRGVSPRVRGIYAPAKFLLRKMLKANRQPLVNKLSFSADLQIHEEDLLLPNRPEWMGAFDVVRAANILNLAYFSEKQLRSILLTLQQRLTPAGLLIVSRTRENDGKNEAAIFRGLSPIATLNGGSEITGLTQPTISLA